MIATDTFVTTNTVNLNDRISTDIYYSDDLFDELYSTQSKELSFRHWTPLIVARKAARFLATDPGVKVLDIGSGVGKFCLSAAHAHPNVNWFGVEQRTHLVQEARVAKKKLGLKNLTFIPGNFTQINLAAFDNFYFFNSFYENIDGMEMIDDTVECSSQLYHYYSSYLYRQLANLPSGTRIASFHSPEEEMPQDYKIVGTDCNDLLTYWIKV